MKKYMVSDKSAGYGGRVTKYKHRFCNTEFGSLKFSKQELGTLCVLLLRGPQTPGELRSRTNRLCEFADAAEVESTLKGLMEREDGPFIARLPRASGARESRYAHLFSGLIESAPGKRRNRRNQRRRRRRQPESTRSRSSKPRSPNCAPNSMRSRARAQPKPRAPLLRRRRLLGDPFALLQPLIEGIDIRRAHAIGIGAVIDQPRLHGDHQLIRQRPVMVE